MGDAKRRRAAKGGSNETNALKARFEALGIDISRPGFYDDPAFLKEEQRDRRFLESYGRWVLSRPRVADEDARVREVVPRLAEIVVARLERHQWFGACRAITGMVSRMLDRMGIWNCVFRGSVTIKYGIGENAESRHFPIVDEQEANHTSTGHQWLAVPPFEVVDATLRYQRWESDDFQRHVPPLVLAENSHVVRPSVEDVVSSKLRAAYAVREGRRDPQLHNRLFKDQARIGRICPARMIENGPLELRYVPAGATASDLPLEAINTKGSQGVPAIVIWREDVVLICGTPD